jgi:hypothetical protein
MILSCLFCAFSAHTDLSAQRTCSNVYSQCRLRFSEADSFPGPRSVGQSVFQLGPICLPRDHVKGELSFSVVLNRLFFQALLLFEIPSRSTFIVIIGRSWLGGKRVAFGIFASPCKGTRPAPQFPQTFGITDRQLYLSKWIVTGLIHATRAKVPKDHRPSHETTTIKPCRI